jgi:hypothetical protein
MTAKGTPARQAYGVVYWSFLGLLVGSALKRLGQLVRWLVLLKVGIWRRPAIPSRIKAAGREGTAQRG